MRKTPTSAPHPVLPGLDRGQLLREVEQRALHDSQSDWSGCTTAEVPPAPIHREIDRWAEQHIAQIETLRWEAEQESRFRIREADAAATAADERTARAEAAAAAAEVRLADMAAVLRGLRPGDDGGDWSDRTRMDENPRQRRIVDALLYGAAGVAELGLNYLAFRLMGTTAFETALLAAAVVLVTVLLPKQLGVLITTARRTRRWTGWPLALMGGAAALWVGVTTFVAIVRTAYLVFPQLGRPALLTLAGVSPVALTAGWLAVSLAVGLAVLLRSAHGHNPYVAAWHAALTEVLRLGEARSTHRADAESAAALAAAERDGLRAVRDRFVPLVDECRALAAELKDRYVHAFSRRRASVEHRSLHEPARPAIHPRFDGSAA